VPVYSLPNRYDSSTSGQCRRLIHIDTGINDVMMNGGVLRHEMRQITDFRVEREYKNEKFSFGLIELEKVGKRPLGDKINLH